VWDVFLQVGVVQAKLVLIDVSCGESINPFTHEIGGMVSKLILKKWN
jgi:hypothetical protein